MAGVRRHHENVFRSALVRENPGHRKSMAEELLSINTFGATGAKVGP
jgi:hypothetical protein